MRSGWPRFLGLVAEQKKRLAGSLEGSEPVSLVQSTLLVRVATDFARRSLEEKPQREVLEASFLSVFGGTVALRFEVAEAAAQGGAPAQPPERDSGTMKLLNAFDGTVVQRSENSAPPGSKP